MAIHLDQPIGPILHNGNGFHGSFNDAVSDENLDPLRPNLVRRHGGRTWERAAKLGTTVVVLLPGYPEGKNWQNDWETWRKCVEKLVKEAKAAKQRFPNVDYHYNIWNEPDSGGFWPKEAGKFEDFWVKTFKLLRELDAQAKISGPSYSVYSGEKIRNFLSNVAGRGACPDILDWHEFGRPSEIPQHVASMRDLIAKRKYDQVITAISINEHSMPASCGLTIGTFAGTEAARVNWSAKGYGSSKPDTLNGLLEKDGRRRDVWWVYQRYANMAGQVVTVEPSINVEAFATIEAPAKRVQFLVGHGVNFNDKNAEEAPFIVSLKGLSKTGFLPASGKALVTVERLKTDPETISQEVIEYGEDELVIRLSSTGGKDRGYFVTIVPQ